MRLNENRIRQILNETINEFITDRNYQEGDYLSSQQKEVVQMLLDKLPVTEQPVPYNSLPQEIKGLIDRVINMYGQEVEDFATQYFNELLASKNNYSMSNRYKHEYAHTGQDIAMEILGKFDRIIQVFKYKAVSTHIKCNVQLFKGYLLQGIKNLCKNRYTQIFNLVYGDREDMLDAIPTSDINNAVRETPLEKALYSLRNLFAHVVRTQGQNKYMNGKNDLTQRVCRVSKLIYDNFDTIFNNVANDDKIKNVKQLKDYINKFVVSHNNTGTSLSIGSMEQVWSALSHATKTGQLNSKSIMSEQCNKPTIYNKNTIKI